MKVFFIKRGLSNPAYEKVSALGKDNAKVIMVELGIYPSANIVKEFTAIQKIV